MSDGGRMPDILEVRATRGASSMIVLGAILLLVSIFLVVTFDDLYGLSGIGGLGTSAVVMLVVSVWRLKSARVTFRHDHFETKVAPAVGWHSVLYSEVTQVEQNDTLLTLYYRKHNVAGTAKPTRVKIRLNEMQDDERDRCIAAFRARLPVRVFRRTR
ncbi:hypothetical protein BWP39_12665 [Paraburkholderia acidicola]|uniref:Uncharacterized protein n=1 Tax=Paraburkholderia acidicola TaxID=1912599 RepID=A0A2A4EY46_9BURK|nr:hypothetical protein [Paraburkholderia acidicola]PCE25372.1 hypothetical protein BWP39_12665 [Paraburkholderia acidicola]